MDPNHFSDSYQTGLQRTISFLVSRGVPADISQDFAQGAWMRGWMYRDQLRDPSAVIPWVNTIALNLFRRSLRAGSREQELTSTHVDARSTSIDEASIDLARILDSCGPRDRELLTAQLRGSTPKELAESEGVSPVAIRLRMMRARRSAREACSPRVPLQRAA